MRTDVKVGIAGGALILIVAVAYYGAKRNEGIALADNSAQDSTALDEILGHAQSDTKSGTSASTQKKAAKKPASRTAGRRPTTGQNSRNSAAASARPGKPKPRSAQATSRVSGSRQQASRPRSQPRQVPAEVDGRPKRVPQNFERTDRGAVANAGQPQAPADAGPSRGRNTALASTPSPQSLGVDPPATTSAPRQPRKQTRQIDANRPQARRTAAAVTPAQASPKTTGSRSHVVQAGDTFAAVAQRYYGSERFTGQLLAANPDVDPRRMQVGTTLSVPDIATQQRPTRTAKPTPRASTKKAAPSNGPSGRQYVVKQGDTFYGIAARLLGAGERSREIYELNRTLIGNDPNQLRVGQALALPE